MNYKIVSTIAFAGLVSACAPMVPHELADARLAYQQASQGPAARVAPAELHKAQEALTEAERSFGDKPDSQRTKDLSYVAQRKAELATALAQGELAKQKRHAAESDFTKTQTQIIGQQGNTLNSTRAQLADSQRDNDAKGQALTREQQARLDAERKTADAEKRAKEAQDSLAKLAMVKQEERGMVITLSGSVLFASNKSELLPEAQTRLDQVAAALLATKERSIVVEGYTDARGSETYNIDLSRRRAESVRGYIVSKGYDADLIKSNGLGKARPIADNASAEGRANNRRVEIVVQKKND